MTKRVLVVDVGYFKDDSYIQYMIVDIDGDFKEIVRYRKILAIKHASVMSKIVNDVFDDKSCDEIYMDIMGSSMCVFDTLPKRLLNVTHGYKMSMQGNHERICSMINDLKRRNIFIGKDAIELYDVIEFLGKENGIYYSDNGLMKIGKYTDSNTRDKVHIILGMYI